MSFCLGRAENLDHFTGAVPHAGIIGHRPVAAEQIFADRLGYVGGQSLAAPLRVFGQGRPLPFHKKLIGTMKGFRDVYLPVFKSEPRFISLRIGRQQLLDREIACFGDNHIKRFFIEITVLFEPGHLVDLKLLIKNKIDVPPVCNHLCHGYGYLLSCIYKKNEPLKIEGWNPWNIESYFHSLNP